MRVDRLAIKLEPLPHMPSPDLGCPIFGLVIMPFLQATVHGSNTKSRYTRSGVADRDGIQFTIEWSDSLLVVDWNSPE